MPWYVFALTDAAPDGSPGKGLAAPVAFRRFGPFLAAVERRGDVPPAEFGVLHTHQQIVERLATRLPAILPVRFGTLLTDEEIEAALEHREDELLEAFDLVRGRRQMTWRLRSRRQASPRETRQRVARPAASGAEYLRRALHATKSAPPAAFRRVRDGVGRLAVAERYQPRTATLPDALYHLIDRTRVDAYATASTGLQKSASTLILSGPWAPYAFAPELF